VLRASQNVAITVMVLLLVGGILLTAAPYEIGTIRLVGVSLLWWYGVVVSPVITVAVATVVLLMASRRRATDDSTPTPASE
jgi:hypothetical protein